MRFVMNILRAGVVATTALLGACEEFIDAPEVGPPSPAARPVGIGTAAAFVDSQHKTVYVVDAASNGTPRLRTAEIGATATVVQRRTAHNELLVLTRGVRGSSTAKPEAPALWRIPADASVAATSVPLGDRFTNLAQSGDGRWAIAYFDGSRSNDDVLFNPNELAVIDLDAAPAAGKPQTGVARSIRSLGGVPRGIFFSPLMTLPDGARSLVVVVSDNYLTLLDVDHLERSEASIGLGATGSVRLAQQMVFDGKAPAIYVRVSNSNDVYGIQLLPLPAGERMGQDFRPSLSLLAAGSQPGDMALFDAGQGQRLLALSPASQQASIVDPASSRSTAIALDHPASRIVLYDGPSPTDAATKKRALLVGGANDATVTFMDLDRIEDLRTRGLEKRVMAAGATEVLPLADRGMALVLHGQSSTAGVSVVSLAKRTVSPITTRGGNLDLGKVAAGRLWVVPAGSDRLGYLDMASLATGDVRLDAAITAVVPLAAPVGGVERVLVSHGKEEGWVTLIDAANPLRESARSLRGFFATNLLERARKADKEGK